MIDLATLDTTKASDEGARIELLHPTTQKPIGAFITILGKHSQVFRDIVKSRANRFQQRSAMAARRGKPIDPKTAEQVEAEAIELLAACTLGWDHEKKDEEGNVTVVPTITHEGEDLTFSVPNAIRVYTQLIWVREQVDKEVGDLENFIKA